MKFRNRISSHIYAPKVFSQCIQFNYINRGLETYPCVFNGEDEIVDFKPEYLSKSISNVPLAIGKWVVPKQYTYTVRNCYVANHTIYDPANPDLLYPEILPEISVNWRKLGGQFNFKSRFLLKLKRKNVESIDEAVILSNSWWTTFYHGVVDSFLKIYDFRHYWTDFSKLKIIVFGKPNSFQLQYMDLLGLNPENILYLDNNTRLRVGRLHLSSSRRNRYAISPDSIKRFSENLYKSIKQSRGTPKRILISRANSTTRRLENENELFINLLKPRGFKLIQLEDLRVQDQISLFQGAEIVIGLHGSGFTNLIFSKETLLIELLPFDSWIHTHFLGICASCTFKYYGILCTKSLETDEDFNLVAPLDEVETVLNNSSIY